MIRHDQANLDQQIQTAQRNMAQAQRDALPRITATIQAPGAFPEVRALVAGANGLTCPIKLAKHYAAQHGVALIKVQTVGTDCKVRTYSGEAIQ